MLEERKIFLRGEGFRPKFGISENVFRRSVKVKEDILKNSPETLHAGVFLTEDPADQKWGLAQPGDFPAFPMIDEMVQFDNTLEAYGGVTVIQGSVPYYTKHYDGTPAKGDSLKCVDGKLVVLLADDPDDYKVAKVSSTNGSTLEIITEN